MNLFNSVGVKCSKNYEDTAIYSAGQINRSVVAMAKGHCDELLGWWGMGYGSKHWWAQCEFSFNKVNDKNSIRIRKPKDSSHGAGQ